MTASDDPVAVGAPSPVRTLITAVVSGLVVIGVIGLAYVVPLPSVGYLRTWADSVGPGFVVLFFLAYAVIRVRTGDGAPTATGSSDAVTSSSIRTARGVAWIAEPG